MNRIVSYLALALLVSVTCAAPAKKSENTDESKQIPQQTEEDTSTNTAEETNANDSEETNQEVIRYQDIQVDNDSKVTSESEPDKQPSVQKVAEHILSQNEAIELVTELTDQDYVEQYLFNEGAQGLFDALDMLREQGWITDTEHTLISDSFYREMMNLQQGPRYDMQYDESTSYPESDGALQPVYPNTFSSFTEQAVQLEQPAEEIQLASLISSLIERISNKDTTADQGAEIIGAIIKLLYGMDESETYSEWSGPEQFLLDLPNQQGYKQDFDIVNSEGRPIGKAERIMKTYQNDDGALGQELAALEKVTGEIGDDEIFRGQGQTYEKESLIPLPPVKANQMFEEEELGSGFESENNLEDMVRYYMDSGNAGNFDQILGKFGNRK